MPTDTKPTLSGGATPLGPDPWLEDPSEHSLLDVIVALARRKYFILAMSLGGGLIVGLIALTIPPVYTATAMIMPPQQQQSTASALLGQLGPLAAASGASLGIKSTADLYVGILGSRTIADDLIRAFHLCDAYGVRTFDEARKVLRSRSSISAGLKDQLIRISIEDRDPRRAAAIANGYVDHLYKESNNLALTESAQRRLFFERQMEAQKKALAESEVAMRATQEKTGVLQVDSQVESVIRSMAQLRAEIAAREVTLASLKGGATAQNPEVVRQETELAATRDQLRRLESNNGGGNPSDPLIPISQVPRAGLEYVRALRDLKYNEALFELLLKQFEAAKIDEAKEAPIIQVVDPAVPPERRSWPPRVMLALAGAAALGCLACLLVMIEVRLRSPEASAKLRQLKGHLIR